MATSAIDVEMNLRQYRSSGGRQDQEPAEQILDAEPTSKSEYALLVMDPGGLDIDLFAAEKNSQRS